VRILLDTNALLYAISEPERLGDKWTALLADMGNQVYVSSISVAEIAIKIAIGKMSPSIDASLDVLQRYGFIPLVFEVGHGNAMRDLPRHHGDPFDRMIIAQAMVEDLAVMTTDRAFASYGVRLVPRADTA
jgi:PIN domain nuclease of toxin-antitoxin system